MRITYIQDLPIYEYNGDFYHPKSANFFFRYLDGLKNDDKLTVYSAIISITNTEKIKKYSKVNHPLIEYKKIPDSRNLKNILSLPKIVRKIVVNSDFCYLRSGLATTFASYYCKRNKIPYMAIVNEDVYKNTKSHSKLFVRLTAYPLLMLNRYMIRNANYACYVTKEYLQRRYPCNGSVLGCSDVEFLDINSDAIRDRYHHIENHNGNIILGSVGLISTAIKGQDTVIKAIAELKKDGFTNYEYWLVGSGSKDWLNNLAITLGVAEQIKFIGEKSHNDVLKWFENIDIYLHPSRSEGLPRTILEAMTKATPCICSNVGGIPELLDEDYLFEYDGNEVTRLKALIRKMNPDEMRIQAKRNFEKSKEYDPVVLAQIRSTFFSEALNNNRK